MSNHPKPPEKSPAAVTLVEFPAPVRCGNSAGFLHQASDAVTIYLEQGMVKVRGIQTAGTKSGKPEYTTAGMPLSTVKRIEFANEPVPEPAKGAK